MRLVQIQPPDAEPLTVEEARTRLNITSAAVADEVLEAFITAAREGLDGVDGYLGRAIMTQTWQLLLPGFPACDGGAIEIPLPPLQDVTEISYIDGAGATAIVASSDFEIRQGQRPYIEPAFGKAWPSARCGSDSVVITFIAGYGDAGADVPESIRSAIALEASALRSLSGGDQMLTSDSVVGLGAKTYDRERGVELLSTAASRLVHRLRVLK